MVMMLNGGHQLLKPYQSWSVRLCMAKARSVPSLQGKIYCFFQRTMLQYDRSYAEEQMKSRPPFINRGIRLCVLLCDTTQLSLD